MSVLTLTAALTDVLALDLNGLADGLSVRDLRLTDVRLDLELSQKSVDDDVEVQLAHTGDDGLTGLLVGVGLEGGVFFRQLHERDGHLLLTRLGLGLDRDVDDRFGELHALEHDRLVGIAKRVARGRIFETDQRDDVAGVSLFDLGTAVGVHSDDTSDPLALVLGAVEHIRTRLDDAGVDAEERQLTDERIRHDLERKTAERRVVVRLAVHDVVLVVGIVAFDRRDVDRRGQIVDDGVEQQLNALVAVSGTAEHGGDVHREDALADRLFDLVGGDFLLFEQLLHQLLVEHRRVVEQFLSRLGALFFHVLGDLAVLESLAVLVGIDDRDVFDKVDDADEVILFADGLDHSDRGGVQSVLHHLEHVFKVRSVAVHLVDERDARNVVLGRLSPNGLGLGLNAAACAEDRHRAVEDAERTLDFNGEVDVSGGVDEVDAAASPSGGRRGGSDGDTSLLLLDHPVHRRAAVVDLADLVVDTGVIQNSFARGGLARVDMRHDTDVAGFFQSKFSRHVYLLCLCRRDHQR